jgi:hypothetical protein
MVLGFIEADGGKTYGKPGVSANGSSGDGTPEADGTSPALPERGRDSMPRRGQQLKVWATTIASRPHCSDEAVEKVEGVVWTGGGFGVILHAESAPGRGGEALAGAVVQVYVR